MHYPDVNFFIRKRYFVCFWTFVGHILLYVLRANLSIGLVAVTYEQRFTFTNATVTILPAAYNQNSPGMGFIFSSFTFGYFFTPLGGWLTGRYGGTTVFGAGIAGTALLTVLSQFLLRINFLLFGAARLLEGVFESFSVTAAVVVLAAWAPPQERSRLNILGFVGVFVGMLLNNSICGFVLQEISCCGVFTVTGGAALIWYVIWFLFISKSPNTDRFITQTERNYFKNFPQLATEKKKLSYPWKKMVTSKPVWAVFNMFFCFTWTNSFILFYFHTFVRDVFKISYYSYGPQIGSIIGMVVSAFIADYLRSKKMLSQQTVHRIYITLGQLSCVILLLIIGFSTNFDRSLTCFILMRMLSTAADVSYFVLFIDTFGEYAAMIRGFAGIFCNISSELNPKIMGFMITDHSRWAWNSYFLLVNLLSIFSLIIYYIWGSGELQEWANSETDDETEARHGELQEWAKQATEDETEAKHKT